MFPLRMTNGRINRVELEKEYLSNSYTVMELAHRAGTTPNSIRTILSTMGLTRNYRKVSAFLTKEQWRVLETEALLRDYKPCALAVAILSTVIRDDLFDAVLDTTKPCTLYRDRNRAA